MNLYKGTIVKESLNNPEILVLFTILEEKLTVGEDPWTLVKVWGDISAIQTFSKNLKEGGWYAHFWQNNEMVVVFKNKIFIQKVSDKNTWREAIEYGLSVGIPEGQLDFLTEE